MLFVMDIRQARYFFTKHWFMIASLKSNRDSEIVSMSDFLILRKNFFDFVFPISSAVG